MLPISALPAGCGGGLDWKGKERKGKERKGKERKGKERKGKEWKGKERKGKEKTTPFGINLMRSQVLYWAAQRA